MIRIIFDFDPVSSSSLMSEQIALFKQLFKNGDEDTPDDSDSE
jgi:hypothetical protein